MKHFLTQATEYLSGYNLSPETYYTPLNILKMTANEKKEQLVQEFKSILLNSECGNEAQRNILARKCAILTVKHIILAEKKDVADLESVSKFEFWFEIYNLLRN